MRVLVGATIVTIIICIFSFYSTFYINETATELINSLNKIEKATIEENWDSVEKGLEYFSREWKRVYSIWEILIEHSEIDNIDISLSYIRAYTENQNSEQTVAELKVLITQFERLRRTERLTIPNIL
ncbi:MAG: DUF4363 family protein [Peptococcales bacterium]